MEEIIEGCFKLFFGLFAILAVPVLLLYGAFLALRWLMQQVAWLMNELYQLLLVCWPYIFGGGAALLGIAIGAALAIRWWEIHQVKRQRQKALRKLGHLYQQTAKQMDELGQATSGGTP